MSSARPDPRQRSLGKRTLAALLRLLPAAARHALVRQQASFPDELLDGCRLEVARTFWDYEQAFRLVHDSYVDRGWIQPQANHLWFTSFQLAPASTVLVLRRAGAVIGTVSVITDSPAGLPIDATFRTATDALRRRGRRVAEVSGLALAAGERRSGLGLFLTVAMWRYAFERLGVTDLVVAVSAGLADYYGALFNFAAYTPVRSYQGFGAVAATATDDPVVGLHHEIATMHDFSRARWPEPGTGRFNLRSLGDLPFPSRHELPPASDLTPDELARYQMSTPVRLALLARLPESARETTAAPVARVAQSGRRPA